MSRKTELIIPANIANLRVIEPNDNSLTIEMDPDITLAPGESIEYMQAEVAYIREVPEEDERQIYESTDAHLSARIDPTQVVDGVAEKYKLEVHRRRGIVPFRTRDGEITGEIRPSQMALVSYNVSEITEEEKIDMLSSNNEQIPALNALVPSSKTLEKNQNNKPVQKVVRIAAISFKRKTKLEAA